MQEGKIMIGVIAKLTITAGQEATFEAAAKMLVTQVNAGEPDCLMYELFRSKQEASTYIFMEKYKDQAALDAHGKTDYFLASRPVLGACLAGAPDIQVYEIVA